MLKLKSISLLLIILNCIHISFKIILVHYINVLTFLLTISCRLCFTFLFSILYSVCSYLHFNIYCFLFLFMPWFKQTLSNNIQSLRELLFINSCYICNIYLHLEPGTPVFRPSLILQVQNSLGLRTPLSTHLLELVEQQDVLNLN